MPGCSFKAVPGFMLEKWVDRLACKISSSVDRKVSKHGTVEHYKENVMEGMGKVPVKNYFEYLATLNHSADVPF